MIYTKQNIIGIQFTSVWLPFRYTYKIILQGDTLKYFCYNTGEEYFVEFDEALLYFNDNNWKPIFIFPHFERLKRLFNE